MASSTLLPRSSADAPLVRIELRQGGARPVAHDVTSEEFLIGSVPGCDLRLPGANLPPIIAQIVRRTDGVRIRRLAPAQPILLNGQPVASQATLAHGDILHIGTNELHVNLGLAPSTSRGPQSQGPGPLPAPAVSFVPFPGPPPDDRSVESASARRNSVSQIPADAARIEEQRQRLTEQAQELDADRVLWYRRRDEIERDWRDHQERMRSARSQLQEQEQRLASKRAEIQQAEQELARVHADHEARTHQVERERKEVEKLRAELQRLRQEITARTAADSNELEQRERAVEQRERQLQTRIEEFHAQLQKSGPRPLAPEPASQFRADLIPLDKRAPAPENTAELGRRYEQLQREAQQMEDQARQLDDNSERMRVESDRLAEQRREQEAAEAQLAERNAQVENQQVLLATLRTRLEKLRDELRQQAQQLSQERTRQEEVAAQLQERLQATEKLQFELQAENANRAQERAELEERSAALQAAVAQMRELKAQLDQEEQRLQERTAQVDQQAAEQAERAGLLKARAQQLLELQQRTEADRLSIREREAALLQAEETRRALAEQLRRRGEDLTARTRALDDQAQILVVRAQELQTFRAEVEAERNADAQKLSGMQQELTTQAAEIERLSAALQLREENLRRHLERLKEAGQTVVTDRQALLDGRLQWEAEQQAVLDQIARARSELQAFRDQVVVQAAETLRQAPEAELSSQGVSDLLAQARAQLRGHLAELHSYARQSQEDLQELRAQVQAEAEHFRQQELALQRTRSEHRLAVTAFRQQLIDWQGRVGDLRQLFTANESRLDLRENALENTARAVDAAAQDLARQTETLQQRDREVTERKQEVERHLKELRAWYRAKLRDLTQPGAGKAYHGEVLEMPVANGLNDPQRADEAAGPADDKDILSLTGDVDAADRQLGELLLSLDLVDADMLMPLWSEARRQRRSLRQILLSSGAITLYQMALIEAGNLGALMLGPYRVIDRVQTTPRETLYRVFDPSRNALALLRHLAESEMQDAVHPDEYRQRFGAATALAHPNLAATYAVTEVQGRPAVLQEWVSGLPSSDWPALAAVPGVWYRLLGQAALALQAAHAAGLPHGRLDAQHFVLTANGTVKLTGIGEPTWLAGAPTADDGERADLAALGRIAADWSLLVPRRKTSKPRALPQPLSNLLRKLGAFAFSGDFHADEPVMLAPVSENERFATSAALLDELEAAGAELPANSEAWDRLVKHVSENVIEGAALRRTA